MWVKFLLRRFDMDIAFDGNVSRQKGIARRGENDYNKRERKSWSVALQNGSVALQNKSVALQNGSVAFVNGSVALQTGAGLLQTGAWLL